MDKPNTDILSILYKNRKHIFLITFISVIVATIITLPFILKPKFRSQAYLYPANMVPFFMEQNYNNVSHSELLLQFFNSYDVRTDVRRKLRLDKHYGLDTTISKFQTYFDYMFEENIKTSLTRYESIELTVLDHDPDTAKLIASAIIESVNKLILKQHLSKFNEYISTNKAYLNAKRNRLDSLKERLQYLSKNYGLLDLTSQLREASRNYYRLMAEGKENVKLNEVFTNMQNYGPELITISNCIKEEAKTYAEVENDVEKAIRDFNRKLTYMIVASEPTKPDSKYWPKKGIIISITALASFLLSCLYFIYIGKVKEVFERMKSTDIYKQNN